MLNSLRKSAGTWVVKVFLGILVLSFAVWGIGDIFRVQPDTAVATVGDMEISQQEFLSEFNNELRRLQATFGPSFDQEQARAIGLTDSALQRLTQRALYDLEVNRLGLTMSDEDVVAAIRTNPAFIGELGTFDRFRFEQALNQAGFSEDRFVAATRTDGARNQLLGVVASGVSSPRLLVDAIFRYQQESRVFEIVTVSNEAQGNVDAPDEVALREYYDGHNDQYMAPEYRALTFVILRPEDLVEEVLVSDDDLLDAYESRRSEFSRAEQRQVEQIVLADEAAAIAVVDRLRGGADFFTVAREAADLDEDTVRLGLMTRDELLEELADPVFALEAGAVSDPVESVLGWHVFRVPEIVAGEQRGLDEVRDQLLDELKLEGARDALFDLANRVDDELAGGAGLEEIAEALNLSHGRIAAVDAAGRNRDGQPADGLPETTEFVATAFATAPDDEPVLNESDDGSYFLVRVDDVMPPALRRLDEVRQEVETAVLAARRSEAAEAKAQILADKSRAGANMTDLATEADSALITTEPLARARVAVSANLSADLVTELFRLNTGEVATGPALDGTAHMVVRLVRVDAADPAADSERLAHLTQLLDQSLTGDLVSQYRDALSARYPVEVNDRVIDTLFDQRGYPG